MSPVVRPFVLTAALATILLTGCSSMVDTPNQQVQILTPGAEGARCVIQNTEVRYITHPPETVAMKRIGSPMTVVCDAPGNRTKTIVVYPHLNSSTFGNITTAGLGSVYDYFSGAFYDIPNPITVDFRHTVATSSPLPKYHNIDTVSPFATEPEDIRDVPALHPGEQNLPIDSAPLKEVPATQDEEQRIPTDLEKSETKAP